MKKALLIAAAALVVTAPAALAKESKEIDFVQVCGASGCKAIKPVLRIGHEGLRAAVVPALQSYYVLRFGVGDGTTIVGRGELYFIPGAGLVAGQDSAGPIVGWSRLTARAAATARKVAQGLKPFAAPMPARAYVGMQRVSDAAPFAALLGPLERAAVPRSGESPVSIELRWARPNPWSSAGALLSYLPKARVVIRLDGFFRVPESVADRIDRIRR
jgi:hypothetical protein